MGSLANNMQNFPTYFRLPGNRSLRLLVAVTAVYFFTALKRSIVYTGRPVGALIVQDLIRIYKGPRLFQVKNSLYNESYIFYN